jgi:hypothetical protein
VRGNTPTLFFNGTALPTPQSGTVALVSSDFLGISLNNLGNTAGTITISDFVYQPLSKTSGRARLPAGETKEYSLRLDGAMAVEHHRQLYLCMYVVCQVSPAGGIYYSKENVQVRSAAWRAAPHPWPRRKSAGEEEQR